MDHGVRRNITDYPKLREDKMWLSYNRTVLALAASQNLSEVFDITYVPSVEEETEFKKTIFLFTVCSSTV